MITLQALLEEHGRIELEKAQAEANHTAALSQVEQLQSTIPQLQQQLHVYQLELEQKRTGTNVHVHVQMFIHVPGYMVLCIYVHYVLE